MRANGLAVCNAACACACAMCWGIRVYVLPAALTCVRGETKGEREGGEEEEEGRRNAMWNTLALDGSLSLSRPRGKFGSCFKPG